MDSTALQRRLGLAFPLLAATSLLLLGIGFQYATETTIGVFVHVVLIGYGLLRDSRR